MLKYFFEAGTDRKLFDGLAISAEKELCEKYTGKFPVISISLKGVGGRDFEAAKNMLRSAVGNEAMRFAFLEQSERLTERERQRYSAVVFRTMTVRLQCPIRYYRTACSFCHNVCRNITVRKWSY